MNEIKLILRDLRAALTEAFNLRELEDVVLNHLLFRLEVHINTGQPLKFVVSDLVDFCERRNLVDKLISGALDNNPFRDDLKKIAADYAEFQRHQDAERIRTEADAQRSSERRLTAIGNQVLERIIVPQETTVMFNLGTLERALLLARAVGRAHVIQNGQRVGFGTGFMISPALCLTNHHIWDSAEKAQQSRIEFDFQTDADGGLRDSQFFRLDPERFFLTDQELDFSVVAVEDISEEGRPLSEFGMIPLHPEAGKILIGESFFIIHHPQGGHKQIAFEGQLTAVLEDFLHYRAPTAGGSAGSPLFNYQGEVFGLHHAQVPMRNDQGQILTEDGRVWSSDMSSDQIAWLGKEGVRVSRILEKISRAQLPPAQSSLRDEMFAVAHHSV